MEAEARPVRSEAKSPRSAASAPSMRRSRSSRSISISFVDIPVFFVAVQGRSRTDLREPAGSEQDIGHGARLLQRENHNGQVVVTRQSDGRCVHHLEVLGQYLVVTDALETPRLRIQVRIAVV